MAVAELLAVRQQIASCDSKSDYAPKDCSLANTMRAIHECLDLLHESVLESNNLFSRLASAVTDNYQRKSSKKARFRPKVSEKRKLSRRKSGKLISMNLKNSSKFNSK